MNDTSWFDAHRHRPAGIRAKVRVLAGRLSPEGRASIALARAVMESVGEAIVIADAEGRIVAVNPASEVLFGSSASELRGRSVGEVLPDLSLEAGAGRAREQMARARRRGGDSVPVDVSLVSSSVRGRSGFILVARDATVRIPEEQPADQATHDPLTGLATPELFDELLVRAVFRGERSRTPVAVLSVDLDGFGNVNDAFGHRAGDRVLVEIGRRLESAVRPGDLVARLDGDGFAVICENLGSTSDAEKIAGRIVESARAGIPVAGGVATITVSVGIAVAVPGEGPASLRQRADRAMHEMKGAGRAGYRLAGVARD